MVPKAPLQVKAGPCPVFYEPAEIFRACDGTSTEPEAALFAATSDGFHATTPAVQRLLGPAAVRPISLHGKSFWFHAAPAYYSKARPEPIRWWWQLSSNRDARE